jgi:hypothetical protein
MYRLIEYIGTSLTVAMNRPTHPYFQHSFSQTDHGTGIILVVPPILLITATVKIAATGHYY